MDEFLSQLVLPPTPGTPCGQDWDKRVLFPNIYPWEERLRKEGGNCLQVLQALTSYSKSPPSAPMSRCRFLRSSLELRTLWKWWQANWSALGAGPEAPHRSKSWVRPSRDTDWANNEVGWKTAFTYFQSSTEIKPEGENSSSTHQQMNSWMECGNFIQWNTIQSHVLQNTMLHERSQTHKRTKTVWFHAYKISRTGKFTETENRPGTGERGGCRVTV